MKLEIITPEQIYFSGEVTSVTLPGTIGSFTILENHAPIISSLSDGNLIYRVNNQDKELKISGGFIEMSNNVVSVCIESANE